MTTLFPTTVDSDRLRFDPLHDAVAPLDLYEYHRSGEMDAVMRSLGETPHATPRATLDDITESREAWTAGERATYAITLRATEEFVGVAELWVEWEQRKTSFGIWLREPFWGRGYSAERAGAMAYVAFEPLDLELVSVGHEPDNERSKRSIERYVETYGGQYDGIVRNALPAGAVGGPRDLRTYTISQEQWRENVSDEERSTIRTGFEPTGESAD
ncbi:GNAT family N-acetyltransferase [Halomarina rubra]|uniref:GNAT family N-acetyltransferase n=1 Tax=Halomarina rubra TaxID=2071873 RepID=A0ABD6B0S0_9EURY|nr:GNAT family protein [Halomarina rubra]